MPKGQGLTLVSLSGITAAERLQLVVTLKDTPWRNRWNIWVYPSQLPAPSLKEFLGALPQVPSAILVTADIDQALKALKRGRTVLFSPNPTTVKGLEGKFLPVFWSPVHFPKQAGTMGLLCSPQHPALAHFPNDGHSDWQWWNLVKRSRVMVLDSLPPVTPIVESIDNFVNNRRLAHIFEATLGKGRLVMSSFDLLTDADLPEIRQLRYSLLCYMDSPDFVPTTSITEQDLRSLVSFQTADQKTTSTSIYE